MPARSASIRIDLNMHHRKLLYITESGTYRAISRTKLSAILQRREDQHQQRQCATHHAHDHPATHNLAPSRLDYILTSQRSNIRSHIPWLDDQSHRRNAYYYAKEIDHQNPYSPVRLMPIAERLIQRLDRSSHPAENIRKDAYRAYRRTIYPAEDQSNHKPNTGDAQCGSPRREENLNASHRFDHRIRLRTED